MLPYKNRTEAGEVLAEQLAADRFGPEWDREWDKEQDKSRAKEQENRPIVLALPRGGVPVAAVVARKLQADLDLILVRKLGLPGYEEFAMGAIASGGVRVLNDAVLSMHRVSAEAIDQVARKEGDELKRRESAYRGDRPLPKLQGRHVILVDDGLATGATMRAAIEVVRRASPASITLAVPLAPASTLAEMKTDVDDIVCPATPEPFRAIGCWYRDFGQTTDKEVQDLLSQAWQQEH
tara:strand:+ start:1619 stop:2329 length:711 start_codon:yes stop_codon:yes gene_type:complete